MSESLWDELKEKHECEDSKYKSVIAYGVPEWARPAWDDNAWWMYRIEESCDGTSLHLVPEFPVAYCPYCGMRLEKEDEEKPIIKREFDFSVNPGDVNERGANVSIKAHILPDDDMAEAGFKKQNGEWRFFRPLGADTGVSITIRIKEKDENDFYIDVIDEDFGQPYDYQHLLSQNPNNTFAIGIWREVEKYIQDLTTAGIITGHVFGKYI